MLKEEYLDQEHDGSYYHYAIWNRLVNSAARLGSYTHPPAAGDDLDDITAFEPTSSSWGRNRPNRPPILELWMPPTPRRDPTYNIEELTYNGRQVLDWTGRPIRAFRGLPLTISSKVEGFRVEAWLRGDRRLTYRDIVARMRTSQAGVGRAPIFGAAVLASRASDFRDHAGCVAWHFNRNQAQSRAYMDSLRTTTQQNNNLTTDADLTSAQLRAYYGISRRRERPQDATVQSTRRSEPSTNISSSRGVNPSTSRRVPLTSSATGTNTPDSNTPIRHSRRQRNPRRYEEDPAEDERSEHDHNGNDRDSGQLNILSRGDGRERPLLGTDLGDRFEDDTNLVDIGEEEADLTNSFYLAESIEEANNSRVDASDLSPDSDSESDDAASHCTFASEPEDPHDARNHPPVDVREAMMLQEALSATRDDYRRLTGEFPNRIDPMENYFSQWAALQTQLRAVLEVQGRVNEPIILFGLDAWTGGIINWRTAGPALP